VGYELHPETPGGGVPLAEYLREPAAVLGYVRTFAVGFGIKDLAPPSRLANTRRALAVAEHARDVGRLEPFCAAVYDAYWRAERGIESDDELAEIARAARLDPVAAIAAASDPLLLARVDHARQAAIDAGVTGIPTFEMRPASAAPARVSSRVVGCQRYEVLADAVRRAGGRRRTPPPG
jgi:2-hydroxychromene-2-carboxylate isomerase